MGSLTVIFLPLLLKLVGGLALVASLFAVYFGVKRKGVLDERARQAVTQQKLKAQVTQQVKKAEAKDEAVDAKTGAQIEKVESAHQPPVDDQPDKFRF